MCECVCANECVPFILLVSRISSVCVCYDTTQHTHGVALYECAPVVVWCMQTHKSSAHQRGSRDLNFAHTHVNNTRRRQSVLARACVCVSVIWSNLFAFLRSPRDATRFWILDYSACMFSVKSCVVVCVFFLSVECCDWCA